MYDKGNQLAWIIFLSNLIYRFDKQKLRHAYGVLRVNSFAIETIRGGKGRALFPMTALISHSCQPNILHEPISYGSNEFQTNNQGMYILQPNLYPNCWQEKRLLII